MQIFILNKTQIKSSNILSDTPWSLQLFKELKNGIRFENLFTTSHLYIETLLAHCSLSPFRLPPRHTARLHFLASLAVAYGSVFEFRQIECSWELCVPFPSEGNYSLFFHLWAGSSEFCRGIWSPNRWKSHKMEMVGPENNYLKGYFENACTSLSLDSF